MTNYMKFVDDSKHMMTKHCAINATLNLCVEIVELFPAFNNELSVFCVCYERHEIKIWDFMYRERLQTCITTMMGLCLCYDTFSSIYPLMFCTTFMLSCIAITCRTK